MPIQAVCSNPACTRRYTLPDGSEGKSLKCKACGETLVAGKSATRADGLVAPARGAATKPAPPAATATATATAPGTIGRFVVRQKLGAGAFGTVYRAYDPQLDRVVALKVPNPGVMTDAKRVERFLREAKAAASLRHPHIVPVFDAGKDGDQYYIASAFVEGRPLADSIPDRGAEFARAARVVRELAEALAYAHGQGVVHRDVKPANIMIDTQDRVHLMDFGLAARQDEESKLTNDGAVMGTPAYMSPEQARGQRGDAQPATDQYAAGVVLYELLTGRAPFVGPVAIVIHNVIHTDPDPPRGARADTPKDLETICLKAMAKRPEDRYADCQALADDLRRWLEGDPIAARRMGEAERLARWAKKNRTTAGLTAAVAAALLIGTAVSAGFAVQATREAGRADREAVAARDAAGRADREAGATRSALGLAEQNARREVEARAQADEARKTAEAHKERAERAGRELANTLYCANMQVLQSAWEQGHVDRVTRLLGQGAPRDGAPDDRGIEWGYWKALLGRRTTLGRYRDTWVHAVTFGPDDDTIVSGHNTGVVRVWSVQPGAGGRPVGQFRPIAAHKGAVNGVAYARGKGWVASAGADGAVRVWSAGTLAEVRAVTKGGPPWSALAVSPDDRWLAAGDERGGVRLWKTEGWEEWAPPPAARAREVSGLAFAPDGGRLYVAAGGPDVSCWEPATRAPGVKLAPVGTGGVVAVAVSPDGKTVAGGTREGQVVLWSADTGRLTERWNGHEGPVYGVGWVMNGERLVSCGVDQKVHVWNPRTASRFTLRGHGAEVRELAVSPNGSAVVTGSHDGLVSRWDPAARQEYAAVPAGAAGPYSAAAYTADGTRVAAGRRDGRLDLVDLSGRIVGSVQLAGPVTAVAAVPSSALVVAAAAGPENTVYVIHAGRAAVDRKWTAPGRVQQLAVRSDGVWAAAACWDKTCRVWEVATGSPVHTLSHRSEVRAVAFSPDGKALATACSRPSSSAQDRVTVFVAATGAERLARDDVRDRTLGLAFTRDGAKLLVAGGWVITPSATRVLDLATGELTAPLVGHNEMVPVVAVTRDGKRAVTAGRDRTVRTWDLRSRSEVLAVPTEHPVDHLDVAPDDSGVVAVDAAGRLLLIDARAR